MKRMIENITGSYTSTAKVVDGTLILSLPDAEVPTVWRLDLGQVKASALEVRKQKNGMYLLALKTPKDDLHDIAPFDTRGKAVAALMAVSHAMENAHGQIKPAVFSANDDSEEARQYKNTKLPAIYKNTGKKTSTGKVLAGFSALAVLILIVVAMLNMTPDAYNTGSSRPTSSTSGPDLAKKQSPADIGGIPVSADDFLRGH